MAAPPLGYLTMQKRSGKCLNYGACGMADRNQKIAVGSGDVFVCPECKLKLQPVIARNRSRFLLVLTAVLAVVAGAWLIMNTGFLHRQIKTSLLVLSRPSANIFSEPTEASTKVQENVLAFSAFFVCTKKSGWLEVCSNLADSTNGRIGWIKADDVIEWKQPLVAEFSKTDNQKSRLMFNNRAEVDKLIQLSEVERQRRVGELYQAIESRQIPAQFSVCALEPKHLDDTPYRLPILACGSIDPVVHRSKVFQIAGIPSNRNAPEAAGNLASPSGQTLDSAHKSKNPKLDLVFVMDLTSSMEPFLEATVDLIQKVAAQAANKPELKDGVHFGFWGYRDSDQIKGIEFNTKNYTPKLQSAPEFVGTIGQVKVVKVDSDENAKDVFSGVKDGIAKTAWTAGALRFILLVGDAPSHELGHEWNASGMDEHELRTLATDNNILIAAFHLKTPSFPKEQAIAERQFSVLAENPDFGEGHHAYFKLKADKSTDYEAAVNSFIAPIIEAFRQARHVASAQDSVIEKTGVPADVRQETASTNGTDHLLLHGSSVECLGKNNANQPTQVATAWVSEMDLAGTSVPALEVKLLLTRNQLTALKIALEKIVDAGQKQQVNGKDLFTSLQATVAATATAPVRTRQGKSLADLGLVPDFLVGLPYFSRIATTTKSTWNSLSAEEQAAFLKELEGKLSFYASIYDDQNQWQPLRQDAGYDDYVIPVPLTQLP